MAPWPSLGTASELKHYLLPQVLAGVKPPGLFNHISYRNKAHMNNSPFTAHPGQAATH